MSKCGASPEFERKLQEVAAKYAHMVQPRDYTSRPMAEMRFPDAPDEPSVSEDTRCGGGWVCHGTTHIEGCLSGDQIKREATK